MHVKNITQCYECHPKPAPKTYPVCTITSTTSNVVIFSCQLFPASIILYCLHVAFHLRLLFQYICFTFTLQFVHCIVWAKDLLFAKLFGDKNKENDLNVRSSDGASSSEPSDDVFERKNGEDVECYGRRIYDHVFGYNIELALSNDETWKNRTRPKPIYLKDVLSDNQSNGNVDNGASCDLSSISAMPPLGLKNPQDVWSLVDYSKVFLEALKLFFLKREKVLLYPYQLFC